ncbi:hypothetical protein K466DRAFT_604827 [Polyporus arcularius HHB13444]|uniref:Uncharacterized protein n=1 Tax=Polyporus arcularius HHB13444 TaxID=1314778 RepID=A0A5C3NVH1_9APHY|nr:hypothetical protein K466DRAFT_604827 [Polyporus arcularius HHB13444]
MQSPTWNVVFSASDASSHAWGRGSADDFLVLKASVHVLVNSDGAVYMAIVNQDDAGGDLLVFDFGRFWFVSTIRRSYDNALTLRTGRSALVVVLANGHDMDRFDRACDQVLPVHVAGRLQPTLAQLGELGIIPLPTLVGDFLHDDPVVQDPLASRVQAPQEELVVDGQERQSMYEDATDFVDVSDAMDEVGI